MKCGVRFCGGCNPRYDRGLALRKLQEERKDIEFFVAEEGEEYDNLVVIGGCTNCCASHEQFKVLGSITKISQEDHIESVVSNLGKGR